MKLGFLTACLPNIGLEELVKFASAKGFDTLELAAWPVASERDYQARQIDAANFSKDDADKVNELFSTNKLEISAMAFYENNLHPDLKQREAFISHLKKVIDTASLLGVKLVGTFVGARPDKTPTENMKEIGVVFRELTKYAGDKNVSLMIENCPMDHWVKFGLPGNYAYSPELWRALFNEVPAENFGLNLDPSHLYWLGIDHVKLIKEFMPKIFHTHAKDTEMLIDGKNNYGVFGRQINPIPWKSGWWQYRMPGLGEIDWGKFISELKANGYEGVLSIEHEDPMYEGEEEKIKEGLELGYKHLSQFI